MNEWMNEWSLLWSQATCQHWSTRRQTEERGAGYPPRHAKLILVINSSSCWWCQTSPVEAARRVSPVARWEPGDEGQPLPPSSPGVRYCPSPGSALHRRINLCCHSGNRKMMTSARKRPSKWPSGPRCPRGCHGHREDFSSENNNSGGFREPLRRPPWSSLSGDGARSCL